MARSPRSQRPLLAAALLAVIVTGCGAAGGPSTSTSAGGTPDASATQSSGSGAACAAEPRAHVYHPDRLHILDPCVTVSGTVALLRHEPDGDDHIGLLLDPGQLCDGHDCLDDANRRLEHGYLVVEPVCEHAVTQADAVSACEGFSGAVAVPALGTHTTVTGPWVLDVDHGWNEIHPAERFGSDATAQQSPAPPDTSAATASAGLPVTITASRYGYVAASTSAGAVCSAKAALPSGRLSSASGIAATRIAGPDGAVSWTYATSSSTTPGTGTHTVTCQAGGQTASATAHFTVPS